MTALLKELFEMPKENEKVKEKSFLTRISVSVVLMIALMVGMSLSAFAYFSASVTTASGRITAANYDLAIEIMDEAETAVEISNRTAVLKGGAIYTVTLSYIDGSASTGFCVITMDGNTYHTQQIGADTNADGGKRMVLSFSVKVAGAGNAELTFAPNWGTSSYYAVFSDNTENDDHYIENGETVEISVEADIDSVLVAEEEENTTEEKIYMIESGDTLYSIAERYGTTPAKLQAYNNIEDPERIQIGQIIRIPPEDWEIPEETPTEETTEPTDVTESTGAPESAEHTDTTETTQETHPESTAQTPAAPTEETAAPESTSGT